MSQSEKGDWQESDVKGGGERREWRDQIRVGEDGKAVYWSRAEAAGTLRVL